MVFDVESDITHSLLKEDETFNGLWATWKDFEHRWKENRDVKVRDQRNRSYNQLAKYLIDTDLHMISTHFNEEIYEYALKAGRETCFISLPCDEIISRVSDVSDYDESLAHRLAGAYCYMNSIMCYGPRLSFASFIDAVNYFKEPIVKREAPSPLPVLILDFGFGTLKVSSVWDGTSYEGLEAYSRTPDLGYWLTNYDGTAKDVNTVTQRMKLKEITHVIISKGDSPVHALLHIDPGLCDFMFELVGKDHSFKDETHKFIDIDKLSV